MSKKKPSPPATPAAETDLPEGWSACALGEVVSSVKGKKPQNLVSDAQPGLIPYIDIRAFETGEYREFTAPDSAKVASKGDLLIVWDGARSGLVGRMPCEGAVGSTLAVLKPLLIRTDYLQRFLQINFDFINSNARGTGIPHVDPGILWSIEFPAAPLAEQKRIVAKVEELLGRVNAARARLTRLPAILKRFRQSVLAAACSGQLTANWRNKSPAADTAESVLQGIATARQSRISNQGAHAKRRRACDRQSPNAIERSSPLEFDFPDIPDTWTWVSCGELCQPERALTYGVIKLGPELEDGVPTLRSSDVRWLAIEDDRIKRISPRIAAEFSRTFLEGGELLITVRGTLGGVAVTPARMRGYNVSREVAVVPLEPILAPWFFAFAVAADWSQNWLSGVTKGVAYTGVNIEDLKRLPLPVPPLSEQREIVRRVEALFALADGIEAHVRAATVRAERMPQAILARAFRGELVPTEAELARAEGRDYEPASVLLARIHEARQHQEPARRQRRTARRSDPWPDQRRAAPKGTRRTT